LKTLTIFRDDLAGSDASKTSGEVGGEDCRRLKHWDRDGDKLGVGEMGLNAFQLELGGLGEGDREENASSEDGAESHRRKVGEVEVVKQGEPSALPVIFQLIATRPPPFNITGDDGDDGDGGTATATLWPRV
jgi:hypothetical protein